MIRIQLLLLFFTAGTVACSDNGTSEIQIDIAPQTRTLPDNVQIMEKVYDSTYAVPEFFYVDERANTPRSYTLYHVKDASVSYERCTNNYYEALEWEATDNKSRAVRGYYVGSTENDKYFEFVRELSYTDGAGNINDLTSPGFARVFKCDYVNRDGVDRNLLDGYAGILGGHSQSTDDIRELAEYLWQFTFFWPARKTVLDTFSTEQPDTYRHTLLLAFLSDQGAAKCDLIQVVDWIFTVNKSDGSVSKEFRHLHEFESEVVSGTPQQCPH